MPQGLFQPTGCISIFLFFTTGIISTGQFHLYPAFFYHRDYFAPVRCISILHFFTTGITLPRSDASLSCSFAPQGLFPPTGCIPILHFFTTGIISPRSDTSPIVESISARPFRQLLVCSAKIVYHSVVIPTAIFITPSLSKDSIFVFSPSLCSSKILYFSNVSTTYAITFSRNCALATIAVENNRVMVIAATATVLPNRLNTI